MKKANKTLLLTAAAFAASALVAGQSMAATAKKAHKGTVYEGKQVSIGKGVARVVVRANAAGTPTSMAIVLTQGVLKGLPAKLNKKTKEGGWEYPLAMPTDGPKTGITHVVIDWNPHGHPPPHVYTVPHFDFHFYAMSAEDVDKIAFSGPKDPATAVTDADIVPAGYKVIPPTAVDKMGVHAVKLSAPEFHGKPFTATFIYGYYKNELTFVEPMITRAYLESKPSFSEKISTPKRYSLAAYYPTSYSVRYNARWKSYIISLNGLKHAKP